MTTIYDGDIDDQPTLVACITRNRQTTVGSQLQWVFLDHTLERTRTTMTPRRSRWHNLPNQVATRQNMGHGFGQVHLDSSKHIKPSGRHALGRSTSLLWHNFPNNRQIDISLKDMPGGCGHRVYVAEHTLLLNNSLVCKHKTYEIQLHTRSACSCLHVALCAGQCAFWHAFPQYRTVLHALQSSSLPFSNISAVLPHSAHAQTLRPAPARRPGLAATRERRP
jgi:hypothetical protein